MTQILPWCLILAALILFARKWLPWLGHLPGDFTFQRGNLTVFLPLGTSLLFSILLSLIMAFLDRR